MSALTAQQLIQESTAKKIEKFANLGDINQRKVANNNQERQQVDLIGARETRSLFRIRQQQQTITTTRFEDQQLASSTKTTTARNQTRNESKLSKSKTSLPAGGPLSGEPKLEPQPELTKMPDPNQQQVHNKKSPGNSTAPTKLMDPQQMHVCRLCDKLLSSSSSLDRHMLTHSGERPFVCKRCHMTFTTNGNMHRHMRTHLHKDSLARQQQEQMQLKSLVANTTSQVTQQHLPPPPSSVTISGQPQPQINWANSTLAGAPAGCPTSSPQILIGTNKNHNNNANRQDLINNYSSHLLQSAASHHHHHHHHQQQQQQQHHHKLNHLPISAALTESLVSSSSPSQMLTATSQTNGNNCNIAINAHKQHQANQHSQADLTALINQQLVAALTGAGPNAGQSINGRPSTRRFQQQQQQQHFPINETTSTVGGLIIDPQQHQLINSNISNASSPLSVHNHLVNQLSPNGGGQQGQLFPFGANQAGLDNQKVPAASFLSQQQPLDAKALMLGALAASGGVGGLPDAAAASNPHLESVRAVMLAAAAAAAAAASNATAAPELANKQQQRQVDMMFNQDTFSLINNSHDQNGAGLLAASSQPVTIRGKRRKQVNPRSTRSAARASPSAPSVGLSFNLDDHRSEQQHHQELVFSSGEDQDEDEDVNDNNDEVVAASRKKQRGPDDTNGEDFNNNNTRVDDDVQMKLEELMSAYDDDDDDDDEADRDNHEEDDDTDDVGKFVGPRTATTTDRKQEQRRQQAPSRWSPGDDNAVGDDYDENLRSHGVQDESESIEDTNNNDKQNNNNNNKDTSDNQIGNEDKVMRSQVEDTSRLGEKVIMSKTNQDGTRQLNNHHSSRSSAVSVSVQEREGEEAEHHFEHDLDLDDGASMSSELERHQLQRQLGRKHSSGDSTSVCSRASLEINNSSSFVCSSDLVHKSDNDDDEDEGHDDDDDNNNNNHHHHDVDEEDEDRGGDEHYEDRRHARLIENDSQQRTNDSDENNSHLSSCIRPSGSPSQFIHHVSDSRSSDQAYHQAGCDLLSSSSPDANQTSLAGVNEETIEDISQSYVKTANPNATRKGGKRNRHCYKCKLCTYSSVDRCTLVRHLRIHSGERPYICGICRYAFTTKANCERHVRKRHKKQYNSLGGAGNVKGSNGGGRSLIITDHSNHQTIPVKVNPVAAQTISQTLQKIQEKQQQQANNSSDCGVGGGGGGARALVVSTPPTTIAADHRDMDHHIERIGRRPNDGKSMAVAKSSLGAKRKHRQDMDALQQQQQHLAYQNRRFANKQTTLMESLFSGANAVGMGPIIANQSHELLNENQSKLGQFGPKQTNSLLCPSQQQHSAAGSMLANQQQDGLPGTTSELFANIMAQLQQVSNNNNIHQSHDQVSANNSLLATVNNNQDLTAANGTNRRNSNFLAMVSSTSDTDQIQSPATTTSAPDNQSSFLSLKNLSQQLAQLRDLNLQNPFLLRRNPFDPFNPLDLAAQALDLSCKFQQQQQQQQQTQNQ